MPTTSDKISVTMRHNIDEIIVEIPVHYTLGDGENAKTHTVLNRVPFKELLDRRRPQQGDQRATV
jgi:hypothetical protein